MNVGEIIGYVLLGIGILAGSALLIVIILILTTSVTIHAEYDDGIYLKVKYLFFTIVRSPDTPSHIRKKKRRELKKKKKEEKLRRKKRKAEHLAAHNKKSQKKSEAKHNADSKTRAYEKSSGGKNGNNTAVKENNSGEEEKDKTEKTAAAKINSGNKSAGDSNSSKEQKPKADLQLIMRVIGAAKPHIKRLFKKIRFSGVLIDILVGGDDAAKTAISYGVHCTAIYGLIEFLKRTVSFDAKRITIKADFDLEKTDYYAKATVKLKISTALRCAIWGGLAVMKELKKSETANKKANEVKKAA